MSDTTVITTHEALRLCKQGKIQGGEMLSHLVAGQLSVPVAEMPQIKDNTITGWRPASATKVDGTQWLIAFTNQDHASAFCDRDPAYPLYVTIDTLWVLERLPEGYGIVFNLRTRDVLEWIAAGVSKYRHEVLMA